MPKIKIEYSYAGSPEGLMKYLEEEMYFELCRDIELQAMNEEYDIRTEFKLA